VGDGAVKPFYIQVHQRDNVAIIANPEGLPAGTQFGNGLTLKERIPQSHKVALQHFQCGDPIRRYDQVIGTATRSIAPGSWVNDDAIELPCPPALDDLPLATALRHLSQHYRDTRLMVFPMRMEAWERKTFWASRPRCSALLRPWSMPRNE
jgi:SAF domain